VINFFGAKISFVAIFSSIAFDLWHLPSLIILLFLMSLYLKYTKTFGEQFWKQPLWGSFLEKCGTAHGP